MENNVIHADNDNLGHVGEVKYCEIIFIIYWFPKLRQNQKLYFELP